MATIYIFIRLNDYYIVFLEYILQWKTCPDTNGQICMVTRPTKMLVLHGTLIFSFIGSRTKMKKNSKTVQTIKICIASAEYKHKITKYDHKNLLKPGKRNA